MSHDNYNDLADEQQKALISHSNNLVQGLITLNDIFFPLKFLVAISATGVVETYFSKLLEVTEAENFLDLFELNSIAAQGLGIAASVPFFALPDYLVVAIHNRNVRQAREKYGITDALIESANGQLDGFKFIEYKPFTIGLIKFLVPAVAAFVVYTAVTDMALLLDSPSLSLLTILPAAALIVAALSQVLSHIMKLPVRTESLVGIWGAFAGLAVAATALEAFPLSNSTAESVLGVTFGPLLGSAGAAIPAAVTNVTSKLKREEEVQRIYEGEPARSPAQLLAASLKDAIGLNRSANDSPADATATEETGLLQQPDKKQTRRFCC